MPDTGGARSFAAGRGAIDWFLIDYGEVLSAPLSSATSEELATLANQDPGEFIDRYWASRPAYDLGQTPDQYWSTVLGRELSGDGALVDALTRLDVHGWMRQNPLTLRTLLAAARRSEARLALLSNAPEPLAAAIDGCSWSRHLEPRFYSCRLGHAKPDRAAFVPVLEHFGVAPERIVFVDDRAVNTDAAAALGMRTIIFTSAAALEREIKLETDRC